MKFKYTNAEHSQISGELAPGEVLGNMSNPATAAAPLTFSVGMSPGNREFDELTDLVAAGKARVEAFQAPEPTVPDNPALGDWRVALLLWIMTAGDGTKRSRLSDVMAAVDRAVDAGEAVGSVARERLEYSNNVRRADLLALKDAFGFTAAEVDESLHRAHRVSLGDLSGAWPVAA